MKVVTVLSYLMAAIIAVNADTFREEEQEIWVDRHNYPRSVALPWSASNMRRIGWDADLATKAASTASKCSATTAKGVNVYQSSSKNASSIIDEAFQEWVVETAMSTIKMMPQPGSSGLDVGRGFYNSYSQIVWASTTSVGCATASCSGGEMVVCEYSPPGNDGKSAWYNHGTQGSECPDGTSSSHGLCVKEGDDANNQIAPIPHGKWTYQVYPALVTDIHTALLNAARDIANGRPTGSSSSTKLSATSSTSQSLSEQEVSEQTTTSVTQDDSNQGPGRVKPSTDTENEAKTLLEAHKATTKSKDEGVTKTHETELELSGHDHEEKSTITEGMFGMYLLGVAAVAGIIVFVHFKEHPHNTIPSK